MFSFTNFLKGGAEPDRYYPMQASNSQLDLSTFGVDEHVNCSHKMAVRAMISETQSRSGLFEEELPVVDLEADRRGGKIDREPVFRHFYQTRLRKCYYTILIVLQDIRQISKQQIERIEYRQNTSRGAPVPEGISLPNPASIPKACPEAITNPQEQKNEPDNQEPVPGVNTSKKRGYGKGKGTLPEDFEEVPVDSFSGPTVPLLIGIPATNVLSVGRGSRAEEASQKGRVQRKCDQCCCYIM